MHIAIEDHAWKYNGNFQALRCHSNNLNNGKC